MTAVRSELVMNAAADAACALADGGYLRIYSGEQPSTPETDIDYQVLLAELTLSSPAFGAAVDGTAVANAITDEDSCLAAATATWFRVFASDGTTPLWDGSVGLSGTDIVVDNVDLTVGETFSITAFIYAETSTVA